MDSKNYAKPTTVGWVYLTFFVTLILAGIITKRVYGHPEFMALFHLPAAVFLILAGYDLTKNARAKYQKDCKDLKAKTL
jgi:hypothetical protein